MHPVLLLACVSAAFADRRCDHSDPVPIPIPIRSGYPSPPQPLTSNWDDVAEPIQPFSKYPADQPASPLIASSPYLKFTTNYANPWDWAQQPSNKQTPEVSELQSYNPLNQNGPFDPELNNVGSQYPYDPLGPQDQGDIDSPSNIPFGTSRWIAPQYHQALQDFEAAAAEIKRHFTYNAFKDNSDKDFSYVVIAVVIDGLTRHVAEHGWANYDENYLSLVRSLTERAVRNPEGAAALIGCVFDDANNKINKIIQLINNQWVDYLCKVQGEVCDSLIYGVLKIMANDQLNQEADLMLKLGDASSTFLDSYAPAFNAISTQNAYLYLLKEKDNLRELVQVNAVARKALYPIGGPASGCENSQILY